ncbi:MAG: ATP-dependent DNA helicase RecG [Armatimonadota bacterium]
MTTLPPMTGFWQQLRKPLELELTRGCPDTAIVGKSIGEYTRLWAERLRDGREEETRLALSLARGLRDYATMPVAERRRRVIAAIDMLRRQEEGQRVQIPKNKPAPRKRAATAAPRRNKAKDEVTALPTGAELLATALEELAPRAAWPKLLANKLGIYTARDLLYHIPRDWIDIQLIADLLDGSRAAIVATVVSRESSTLKAKQLPHPLHKYILTARDDSGEAWITSIIMEPRQQRGKTSWSPARLQFTPGQRVFALGKVDRTGKIVDLHMEDIFGLTAAEEEELRPGGRVPLYPLTQGVYQNQVHRMVLRLLNALDSGVEAGALADPLPADIREQYALQPLAQALNELHHPRDDLQHEQARKRLAFEEFLTPQLILARRRWAFHHDQHAPVFHAHEHLPELIGKLVPFAPTLAQLRVMAEIEEDLRRPRVMNRLLQGDVGSGKTLVAAGALALAARSDFQAAIMAPTEILAEQLFLVLSRLLKPLNIEPALLTGSVTNAERRTVLAGLALGTIPIAVGTHALIQEGVEFANLGLVIIDEQHRFGVLQRATLRGKGKTPNALVMTATPIPRTLSLTAYGDLDLSVLDELPPGRHPVETRWMSSHDMEEAYAYIREQVATGRQAYVLCPLVEESEMLQADAAVDMAATLRQVFPQYTVGLLHGRLRPEEKDAAMEDFRAGKTQILACTTVIEVGVDVPNATVMLIHNAERFGLSQLHQLRGRVGRSEHQSACLLVTHPRYNPDAIEGEEPPARRRLRLFRESQDGFQIAEADLELRGPGEYLGTRQSGLTDFSIGSLLRDGKYLEQARKAAETIIAEDPDLAAPHHAELRRRVAILAKQLEKFRE